MDQAAYRKSCTAYRKGHVVRSTADNSVIFDGSTEAKDDKWNASISKHYAHAPAPRGVNAAKRYIRKEGLKSYTVRD